MIMDEIREKQITRLWNELIEKERVQQKGRERPKKGWDVARHWVGLGRGERQQEAVPEQI